MEDSLKGTLLYDIYGKLLTKTQQEIFEQYYLFNLSLREIAQNRGISFQAVRDSIKKSKDMLNNFEEQIGMLKINKNIQKALNICDNCEDLNTKKDELIKLLK